MINLVQCPPNEIMCPNSRQCLKLLHFCDGIQQCDNGEDEGWFCGPSGLRSNKTCESLKCKYACALTHLGPTCYCRKFMKPMLSDCIPADACSLEGTCHQICKNLPNSNAVNPFECSCISGYKLGDDKTSCLAENGS